MNSRGLRVDGHTGIGYARDHSTSKHKNKQTLAVIYVLWYYSNEAVEHCSNIEYQKITL